MGSDHERGTLRQRRGPGHPHPDRESPGAAWPARCASSHHPLFGREDAIRSVVSLVRGPNVRLISLTWPGGIGKTRLAVAQVLGIETTGAEPAVQMLRNALRSRSLVLILDNLEHLRDDLSLISALLQACPSLTVVATSRVRLSLSGEHIVPVESLAVTTSNDHLPVDEAAQSSAVKLFVDRARAVHPTFQLTERNVKAVIGICKRLDGLPLAIELAAARNNVRSPEAPAARLEHRLELLTGGPRDAPARLQTMRAAIAWSVDLLGEHERARWERLGVFVGGFTADAAEPMAADAGIPVSRVPDLLGSLIDHGLVRSATNAEGEPRFVLLETARDYARTDRRPGHRPAGSRHPCGLVPRVRQACRTGPDGTGARALVPSGRSRPSRPPCRNDMAEGKRGRRSGTHACRFPGVVLDRTELHLREASVARGVDPGGG